MRELCYRCAVELESVWGDGAAEVVIKHKELE
jgi:hypothetical protein